MRWLVTSIAIFGAGCGRAGFEPAVSGDHDAAVADDVAIDMIDALADPVPDYLARCPFDELLPDGVVPCIGATGSCTECPVEAIGQIDGAYSFSGIQRLDLGPGSLIQATFTVSLWLRGDPAPSFVTAFGGLIGGTDDNSCGILVNSTGNVLFETTSAPNAREYLSPIVPVDVSDGTWHHVAITWDGTMKRLFVDGTASNSVAAAAMTTTAAIAVAADYETGTPINFYPGGIDELRIYGRALDPSEIAQLAAQ